jgi:formate/nitrite transporter FocA (FNT family)
MVSDELRRHAEEEKRKPELDTSERKKVEQEESLNEGITYEVVRMEGEKELKRSLSALTWAAIAGGMSMGFSFVTEALLRSHIPDTEWRPLITRLGYPIGFLIITLGSQQLFTENTITPIVPLLVKRTGEVLRKVASLWLVVLIGNFIGALLFAMLIGWTEALEPRVHIALTAIGEEALRGGFAIVFIKGIFAGWLVALMVWMLPAAKQEQVSIVIIMTYIIGIASFSHIIVGTVEMFYLVVTAKESLVTVTSGFILPALAGNVVGGIVFVTLLNHLQTVAGGGRQKSY